MKIRNCHFSRLSLISYVNLANLPFVKKLSILYCWAANLGKNTLLSLWRWPTVRLTHNGKMVTDSVGSSGIARFLLRWNEIIWTEHGEPALAQLSCESNPFQEVTVGLWANDKMKQFQLPFSESASWILSIILRSIHNWMRARGAGETRYCVCKMKWDQWLYM